jgi:hypothetical protein
MDKFSPLAFYWFFFISDGEKNRKREKETKFSHSYISNNFNTHNL